MPTFQNFIKILSVLFLWSLNTPAFSAENDNSHCMSILTELAPQITPSWLNADGSLQTPLIDTLKPQLFEQLEGRGLLIFPSDPHDLLELHAALEIGILTNSHSEISRLFDQVIGDLFEADRFGHRFPIFVSSQLQTDIEALRIFKHLFPTDLTLAQKKNMTNWIEILHFVWELRADLPPLTNLTAAIVAYEFRDIKVEADKQRQSHERLRKALLKLKLGELFKIVDMLPASVKYTRKEFEIVYKTMKNRDAFIDSKVTRLDHFIRTFMTNKIMPTIDLRVTYGDLEKNIKQAYVQEFPNDIQKRRILSDLTILLFGNPGRGSSDTISENTVLNSIAQRVNKIIYGAAFAETPADNQTERRISSPTTFTYKSNKTVTSAPNLLPRKYMSADSSVDDEVAGVDASAVITYQIVYTPKFKEQAYAIDPKLLGTIENRTFYKELTSHPLRVGEFKSPTVPKPYRIIKFNFDGRPIRLAYRVLTDSYIVELAAVGLRKDFYVRQIGHLEQE